MPTLDDKRAILYMKKTGKTPKQYPRKPKEIKDKTVSIADLNDLGVETNINKLYAILLHKEKEDANLRSASSFFS